MIAAQRPVPRRIHVMDRVLQFYTAKALRHSVP
jgi:hypothetical protein